MARRINKYVRLKKGMRPSRSDSSAMTGAERQRDEAEQRDEARAMRHAHRILSEMDEYDTTSADFLADRLLDVPVGLRVRTEAMVLARALSMVADRIARETQGETAPESPA